MPLAPSATEEATEWARGWACRRPFPVRIIRPTPASFPSRLHSGLPCRCSALRFPPCCSRRWLPRTCRRRSLHRRRHRRPWRPRCYPAPSCAPPAVRWRTRLALAGVVSSWGSVGHTAAFWTAPLLHRSFFRAFSFALPQPGLVIVLRCGWHEAAFGSLEKWLGKKGDRRVSGCPSRRQAVTQPCGKWSGQRESNPHGQLGRLELYH